MRKACKPNGTCGYYQYLQGTSMAAPHASGVAALIVSEFGEHRPGEVRMDPAAVRRVLETTAAPLACPIPRRSTTPRSTAPPSTTPPAPARRTSTPSTATASSTRGTRSPGASPRTTPARTRRGPWTAGPATARARTSCGPPGST
ncbi:S8 family serine peptidase [Actinokineospora soli]|uniref:S8 family serine peptidase n=1 Tax=Actinokineospora soli TaxID=1048753 RepID=A0ABW2TJC3_9PSEU